MTTGPTPHEGPSAHDRDPMTAAKGEDRFTEDLPAHEPALRGEEETGDQDPALGTSVSGGDDVEQENANRAVRDPAPAESDDPLGPGAEDEADAAPGTTGLDASDGSGIGGGNETETEKKLRERRADYDPGDAGNIASGGLP